MGSKCLGTSAIFLSRHLGTSLKYHFWQVNIFTEEIIRGGSAATLSALLNRIDPVLRNVAQLGR
jgi:alpha-glucan,water dikinase